MHYYNTLSLCTHLEILSDVWLMQLLSLIPENGYPGSAGGRECIHLQPSATVISPKLPLL